MTGPTLAHDGVLKHLAGLSLRLTHDADGVRRELEHVPVSVLDAILDDDVDWAPVDRLRLLHLLALDRRDYVRGQVAAAAAAFGDPFPEGLEVLLERLCSDPAMPVRQAAAMSLAAVLQHSEGITRTRLVGTWALSSYRTLRAAIAQALRWPFPVMGAPSAMELLASDADAEVRAAAAEAAKIRMKEAPRVCGDILKRLAGDPDPMVRRAAQAEEPRPS